MDKIYLCSECGKQSVIFDNRYHGCDAIANNIPLGIERKEYQYKLIRKEPTEVEIRIRNDLTYNEYCEEVNENSVEEFSNAFSSIKIYAVKDGKKKKCFEEETA